MSSARDYLDAGIDALGLLGNPADLAAARDRFRRAVSMDPGMCDAWLGLVVTGDHSSETLRHAHEASATVHRETRRLGLQDTDLGASVASPGFIEVFPYTPASITLAYIAALLTEADYDTAEKLLESYDTAESPSSPRSGAAWAPHCTTSRSGGPMCSTGRRAPSRALHRSSMPPQI